MLSQKKGVKCFTGFFIALMPYNKGGLNLKNLEIENEVSKILWYDSKNQK